MPWLKKLREKDRNILIVFVTTSPDFMMQAFSVHAFHYITKPYKAEQIYKVLDDASSYVSDNSKYIEVMCDRRNTLISLKEIVSVESDAHYINIGVVSGLRYRTRMTITEFLKLADNDTRFIPVNRGIVLNADYIKDIEDSVCVTGNGERFPIKIREKLGLNRASVNICSKKSEKTSGGEHGRIHKISSGIFQLCHNNTVKFILPFTVKKSIKIPDSKDSNALLCSFIILGSLSSIVMTAFDIQNLNFVLFPDLVIFFFLIKKRYKGRNSTLFVCFYKCVLFDFILFSVCIFYQLIFSGRNLTRS